VDPDGDLALWKVVGRPLAQPAREDAALRLVDDEGAERGGESGHGADGRRGPDARSVPSHRYPHLVVTPSLWRHDDFLKLWVGQTIAGLGSGVTARAAPPVAPL